MHDVQRVTGLPHMQPCQRPPGTADGVKGAALSVLQHASVLERGLDDLFRFLDRLRRNVLQRETAERQRHAGLDAVTMNIGELKRAAAEIADDPIRLVKTGYDAERRQ